MIKNITFSAEDYLIQKAREMAVREHKSLNAIFRELLERYVNQNRKEFDYFSFMKKLNYATPGKRFSREEMNER